MTDREALEQTHAILTDDGLRWKQRVQQATVVVADALAPPPAPPVKLIQRGIFTRDSVARSGESASTIPGVYHPFREGASGDPLPGSAVRGDTRARK